MLSVFSTAPLSTTTIAIHIQRIVKNENSQDTSTIQTVLIQSILIGKESQKKNLPFGHCSIWAGYKALQSTKYKTTNCAQEYTQPSAQYDVQTDLTKDSIYSICICIALAHFPEWL